MSKDGKKIIIVKKVVKGHGGHHGGSWKVAYADFVTAMMAFFMVMWILGMDENLRKSIEGYFANPTGLEKGYSSGASPISSGASPAVVNGVTLRMITRVAEQRSFQQVGERIRTRIESENGLGAIAAQVEIILTEDGLRIELVENATGETFFAFGSSELKPGASRALQIIAAELGPVETPVVVEGHTDAAPFGSRRYSNWELSADRANAARRAMEAAALPAERVRGIQGHADRYLRNPENPLDPANRRISVLLPFTTPAPTPDGGEAAAPVGGLRLPAPPAPPVTRG